MGVEERWKSEEQQAQEAEYASREGRAESAEVDFYFAFRVLAPPRLLNFEFNCACRVLTPPKA